MYSFEFNSILQSFHQHWTAGTIIDMYFIVWSTETIAAVFFFLLLLKTADICQGLDCSVMKFRFFLYYRTKWQNKWMLWSKGYERLVENFMTQLTVSYQFPNYLIPIIVKYLVLCLFCESDGLTRNLNNCLNIKLYHNARWCSGQTT